MKIIHTADWHIGQHFFGFQRNNEHTLFLEWLNNEIKKQDIDILLVAGDIFDKPNPSAEDQQLFYKFLRKVTASKPNIQIIIIAGNHDSSARLEAPNPLYEEMNIKVIGTVERTPEGAIKLNKHIIPLYKNKTIQAWCIAVPYLRQGDYPPSSDYASGVKALFEKLLEETIEKKTPEQNIILMGHLHTSGADLSNNDNSERTAIGGIDCIAGEIFNKSNILYTALGHLHKAQKIAGKANIKYAGSPLPMSFSEKNYKQGVELINIENNKKINIEQIPFESPVKLYSIPQQPLPIEEVLNAIEQLPNGNADEFSPFIEVNILLSQPEPSLRFTIETALSSKAVRLAHLQTHYKTKETQTKPFEGEHLKTLNPLSIAENVFSNRYGQEMPQEMKNMLQEVINEIQA